MLYSRYTASLRFSKPLTLKTPFNIVSGRKPLLLPKVITIVMAPANGVVLRNWRADRRDGRSLKEGCRQATVLAKHIQQD